MENSFELCPRLRFRNPFSSRAAGFSSRKERKELKEKTTSTLRSLPGYSKTKTSMFVSKLWADLNAELAELAENGFSLRILRELRG